MITGFNHVSIVVPDLAAAMARLEQVYHLKAGEPRINAEQGVRLVWIDLGNARLELMEPTRPDSPVAKFLERNPHGGIHHFCLNVDGVDATLGALAQCGVRALGGGSAQRNVHGERIAFLQPKDFFGALVELEEHGDAAH
ncbi:MAG: VOC family protein [Burkholderiales bacterium]|nr:VOC family protein [Burkholderiales bacterium]